LAESRISFDRKFRPSTLDDYIGNKVLKKSIKTLLVNDKFPHTVIFHGPRGCGKTSMARVASKELQCLDKTEEGLACGKCKNCSVIIDKFIGKGMAIQGVYEYDMTKLGGVDDVRELTNKMVNRPVYPMKKNVFILDEVQRISPEGQNALLKISEEPKDFLHIILCTTDVDKLIVPLRSRYRQFQVKRATVDEIREKLIEISRAERIKYEVQALNMIINKSNRIVRESIINFESVANIGDVTVENTMAVLQTISEDIYLEYFDLLGKDVYDIIYFIENLEEQDVEYQDFLQGLSKFILDCINMKYGIKLDFYSESFYKKSRKVFSKYSYKQLIDILEKLKDSMVFSYNNPNNAEMAIKLFSIKVSDSNMLELGDEEKIKDTLKKEIQLGKMEYIKGKDEEAEKLFDTGDEISLDDLLEAFPEGAVIGDKSEKIY